MIPELVVIILTTCIYARINDMYRQICSHAQEDHVLLVQEQFLAQEEHVLLAQEEDVLLVQANICPM